MRPLNCSLPGSSVHGLFQARVLEWVDISHKCRILDPNPDQGVRNLHINKIPGRFKGTSDTERGCSGMHIGIVTAGAPSCRRRPTDNTCTQVLPGALVGPGAPGRLFKTHLGHSCFFPFRPSWGPTAAPPPPLPSLVVCFLTA